MPSYITGAKLILEDSIIWNGTVEYEDGRIISVGRSDEIKMPAGASVFDVHGSYLAPGFVDIHNHGYKDKFYYDDPAYCARGHLSHGVTTLLPSVYDDLDKEETLRAIKVIKEEHSKNKDTNIAGIHMEGPFMAGCNPCWEGRITEDKYKDIVDALGGFVKLWALDPGIENIEEFAEYAKSVNPSVRFSMGHSTTTAENCRKLKKYGLTSQTHHGDSGKAPGFAQGTVGAGCDEYALYDPDIYTEVICDVNGVHLAPYLYKLTVKTKGIERIILISDSMPQENDRGNNEAAGIKYGPDLNYDEDGYLYGSHMTIDEAVRNIMAHTGCGICNAVRFASLNPARMLGIDGEVGSIEIGKKANFVIMDDMANIKNVILNGKFIN